MESMKIIRLLFFFVLVIFTSLSWGATTNVAVYQYDVNTESIFVKNKGFKQYIYDYNFSLNFKHCCVNKQVKAQEKKTQYGSFFALISFNNATKKVDTLKPGPFAKKSIPARGATRNFTKAERAKINEAGKTNGCHT